MKASFEAEDALYIVLQVLTILSFMRFCKLICDEEDYNNQVYPSVIFVVLPTLALIYASMAIAGRSSEGTWLFVGMRMVGWASVTLLNRYKEGSNSPDLVGWGMMVIYYIVFFAQGVVDQYNRKEYERLYDSFT